MNNYHHYWFHELDVRIEQIESVGAWVLTTRSNGSRQLHPSSRLRRSKKL